MSISLSRVRWLMGQALLPEHLYALEESVLADSALRFNLRGVPSYGLYTLHWNETLLADGMLSLNEMTLLLPSGVSLVLKKNAKASTLNLNTSSDSSVSVYLHLQTINENSSESEIARQTIQKDEINCWIWYLELSTDQENQNAVETFYLAEFEKQPDSSWHLSSRYIPPLLSLGSVPFLKEELTQLAHRLEAYHYYLTQEITAIYLSGADLVNAKQCQKGVVQLLRFFANLFSEISAHPYEVYEQLKSFYVELCFYHNSIPQFATTTYRHKQLALVFREIIAPLNEQLQFNQSRSPYLPFSLLNGVVQVSLPISIREAKDIFLLIQKGSINKKIELADLKIAAVTRIATVHKFYLQGIPCKYMDRPPFQHSFGPEIDIYQLNKGEEWDYALNELTLGFYPDARFSEEKFFLYWSSN